MVNTVASFAEAWIENGKQQEKRLAEQRRLLRGGVDWKPFEEELENEFEVASFAEAWIEILLVQKSVKLMHGRLLRGGVHWNR